MNKTSQTNSSNIRSFVIIIKYDALEVLQGFKSMFCCTATCTFWLTFPKEMNGKGKCYFCVFVYYQIHPVLKGLIGCHNMLMWCWAKKYYVKVPIDKIQLVYWRAEIVCAVIKKKCCRCWLDFDSKFWSTSLLNFLKKDPLHNFVSIFPYNSHNITAADYFGVKWRAT